MVKRIRVLIVDDSTDTVDLYVHALTADGMDVQGAGSIAEGLARMDGSGFDVIVSDVRLPDGTGWELLERLRGDGVDTPAIALSGYADAALRELAASTGFAEFRTKPLLPDELSALIVRLLADS